MKQPIEKVKQGLQDIVSANLKDGQMNPLAQTSRRMALTEGQVLHFKDLVNEEGVPALVSQNVTTPEGTEGNAYFGFDTAEEIIVTTGQLARRGNGLKLDGTTVEDMVVNFITKVTDICDAKADVAGFKGAAVKVTELRTRPGRNGLQVIPMFEWV